MEGRQKNKQSPEEKGVEEHAPCCANYQQPTNKAHSECRKHFHHNRGEGALQLSQCLLPPVFIGPFPLGHLDLGVARLIDHRYAALCLNTREIRGPLPGVGYSGFCSSLVLLCVLLLRLAASVVSMTVGPFSAFITQC